MKLSVSLNINNILEKKGDLIERIFTRKKLFNKVCVCVVLSEIKKQNVKNIELVLSTTTGDKDIKKTQGILRRYGLSVLSIHQPISRIFKIDIKEIEKMMQFAVVLGAKIIVLHTCSIDIKTYNLIHNQYLKNSKGNDSIKICLENNTKNILFYLRKYCWQKEEFIRFIDKTNSYINFDTTHCGSSKINIIDFFKEYKSKIINIHVSNYKSSFFGKEHLPLNKGDLPMKLFLNILKSEKYTGALTLEVDSNIEEFISSIKFIKS